MQENIKELIKLIQEHPDLPVISMVEQEAVSDAYGYTVASFGRAYVEEYALYNERYYDDRESFKEAYYDYNCEELDEQFDYHPTFPVTDARHNHNMLLMEKYLDSVADEYFKKAIVVYIHPYYEYETN